MSWCHDHQVNFTESCDYCKKDSGEHMRDKMEALEDENNALRLQLAELDSGLGTCDKRTKVLLGSLVYFAESYPEQWEQLKTKHVKAVARLVGLLA